ncbi:MAG: rhomboid family intramembrane serine protease [Prevotella sp.]|nr:rhomboid family intramembrane serine protease [Prevotella sp.]
MPTVTKNLIIINVLCFLAQVLLEQRDVSLTMYGGLTFFLSDYFMPHQLLTYMFLHGSISHLFFNMFAVFMFGRTLEMVWGPKRFLFYYLIVGIGAGLMQEVVWTFSLWDYLSDPQIGQVKWITIGASGAVFGILLAFGMMFPNAELIMLPIPIPVKAKWFVIGYGLLELVLGVANISGDPVAHFAHLGGLLFGLVIILYWKKQNRTNGRFY